MPRESNDPPASHDAAQHGATRRNKQKNTLSEELLNRLFDNDLSPKQLAAIELLLRGLSDAETAAHVGVDRGTVYRWRTDDPEFARVLETQRRILWEQSAQRLQTMYQPALDVLEKQLTGPDARLALRAAALLIRVATPARLQRLVGDGSQPTAPAHPPASMMPPYGPGRSRRHRRRGRATGGDPTHAAAADEDAFAAFLDAYINAPLPGEAGRQCDANANALPPFEDHDEDDEDDEDAEQ